MTFYYQLPLYYNPLKSSKTIHQPSEVRSDRPGLDPHEVLSLRNSRVDGSRVESDTLVGETHPLKISEVFTKSTWDTVYFVVRFWSSRNFTLTRSSKII